MHLAILPLTVAMATLSAQFDYSRHREFWVIDLDEFIICQFAALSSAGYQSGSARVRRP